MAESLSIMELPIIEPPSFCFDTMLFIYLFFCFREEMPEALLILLLLFNVFSSHIDLFWLLVDINTISFY